MSILRVDQTLCDHADTYAATLGPNGAIAHDGNELGNYGEGENLYAGTGSVGAAGRFLHGKILALGTNIHYILF